MKLLSQYEGEEWLGPGIRTATVRPWMLDLAFASGRRLAIGWTAVQSITLSPDQETEAGVVDVIFMQTSAGRLEFSGRRLAPLYDALVAQLVSLVTETGRPTTQDAVDTRIFSIVHLPSR